MATILLSAAGAALGSSMGGTLLGLSMTAVGRFAGATLGRGIDARLMGGSEVVEGARIDRFRLTGAGEGVAIAQVYGRMRVGGHVIWASRFEEEVRTGGGKGAPRPRTRDYSYSVSLAVALCEGEISHISRVWADGVEVALRDLNMRVYKGTKDQLPDPKLEAVEGAGMVPAYRGTAYVVFEDLALEAFGNRVPQFSFEVCRPAQADAPEGDRAVAQIVQGVALMPGTGEFALASEPVTFDYGLGEARVANVNSAQGISDLDVSLEQLQNELPNCGATSLIVSWFGNDLRCGACTIRPRVEQDGHEADVSWSVAGETRETAGLVPQEDGRPVYGGTPSDASVIQAIRALQDAGQAVMYYPFILMDQWENNGLSDPWTGADEQPLLPWRGRITTSAAPGQDGSPDGTAAAEAEVAAFFGTATADDFTVGDGVVSYTGPQEWSYRRFILHQAALAAAAGGVDSFCIGSEMRSLTQIRGANNSFPAVSALRDLAVECRDLLGQDVRIGYAADWSEYFGYQPGNGDRFFHLDPLWADEEIDFIGIDNYMPLSDWREGEDHADAGWRSIYNRGYLDANVEGGEGFDWYYHSETARKAQIRTTIEDGEHDEPWIWRYKDIRSWWENEHHERIGGVRQESPTPWLARSKPIWFTEIGCAAIDKGTNQPNKFLDPKSSESSLPHFSDGRRDELMQAEYIAATVRHWAEGDNNPTSDVYGGPMIDLGRTFVWAWDARPYPWFPGNRELWSDGANWARGHWITGRASGRTLASVVAEICTRAGLENYDVSELYGFVRGYAVEDVAEARKALQPLMLAYGFDAVEREGRLIFRMRNGERAIPLDPERLAVTAETDGREEETRSAEAELVGRVRLRFVEADGDHDVVAEESVLPDDRTHAVATSEFPLSLTRAEGRQTVERWLAEARLSRDAMRIALPPSQMQVGPGDVIALGEDPARWRVDRVEQGPAQVIEAVRIDPGLYHPAEFDGDDPGRRAFTPVVPVLPLFLDLPLMTGEEVPHAPHVAATATPWPGTVAVHDAVEDADYALNTLLPVRAKIGVTETPLSAAATGRIDRGPALQVRMASGDFSSASAAGFLSGRNLIAVGDGTPGNWELMQFRDAQPLAEDRWLLSHRLRGQFGSDGVMPGTWPAGSYVVVIDDALSQIELAEAARRLARNYRIGPASRSYDDPTYRHQVHAFDGNGLRPYRPAHLRLAPQGGAGVKLSWIRRTRIGGDDWEGVEVPLGEQDELYRIRVLDGPAVVREVFIGDAAWTYSGEMMTGDGAGPGSVIEVAQVSATYGAGPAAQITIPA